MIYYILIDCLYINIETEISLQAPPTVYMTTMEHPDLITNNKHLLHSEVFLST